MSERFNLDFHVIVEVSKAFVDHVSLPKEGFIVYEPPKILEPAHVVPTPVETVGASSKGFYEKPPYPANIQENKYI
jgi:hypothetical protein